MATIVFPPYGEFARGYKESVDPRALAPAAWRPALPLAQREATWLQWRTDTLAIISRTLWPLWDYAGSQWSNPDTAHMLAMTQADFVLFDALAAAGVLNQRPDSPVAAAAIPTHLQYFVDEDTNKLGERYYGYDTTLPTEQMDKIIPDFRAALRDKAGSASIQFKQMIQRPRAYQIARLLGREHRLELATTSMTSSMSSGHCFQGCLVAVGIYEAWLARGFAPSADQLTALGQFGVDIGDRRVFAGVHYPSDNLSSWIMDLRLVVEVSPDKRLGAFLARSIRERSAVYKLLKSRAMPEHSAALAEVDALADALIAA